MATDINDLPLTSPHGSDFGDHAQILGLAPDPNATCGTATAHRNTLDYDKNPDRTTEGLRGAR